MALFLLKFDVVERENVSLPGDFVGQSFTSELNADRVQSMVNVLKDRNQNG